MPLLHLVEINSDNPAHSANAITGTRPGHDKESRMSTIPKNNSETVAHTPGRAAASVWILQVVLAAIIAGGGISSSPATRSHGGHVRRHRGWPVAPVPGRTLEVAGGVGLLIPALAGLASLGLAALLTGAVITDQFVLEQSLGCRSPLVVAAVIARTRWSRTEAVVGTLLRR